MHEALAEVIILLSLILIFSISTNTVTTMMHHVERVYSTISLDTLSHYIRNLIISSYLESTFYNRSIIERVILVPFELKIRNINASAVVIYYKGASKVINFNFTIYANAHGPVIVLKVKDGIVSISSS